MRNQGFFLFVVLAAYAGPERAEAATPSQWHGLEYRPPKSYLCYRAPGPLTLDGKLDEPDWQAVDWTDGFVDIEGHVKPLPRFRTRAKMLWDDEFFYVGAELEEPHVWGTLTAHDSIIYQDNDFEVFIDPDGDNHDYYEFEMNALNTGWDLLLLRGFKGGGSVHHWDIHGLKTAVHVQGTLNDPSDVDKGWSLEIAFPWRALRELAHRPAPPEDGDQWRVNFSRVQWEHRVGGGQYLRIAAKREDNWVWTPQWVVNMHRPETWGYVQFSTAKVGQARFRPDPAGPAQHLLAQVYYTQQDFKREHQRFARSLEELGLEDLSHESLASPLVMEVTEHRFEVTAEVKLADGTLKRWHIQEDSRMWKE